jgi:hypothetical protein
LYAGAELSGEAPIGPLGSGDAAGGWEPHAIAGVESHLQQRSLPPKRLLLGEAARVRTMVRLECPGLRPAWAVPH